MMVILGGVPISHGFPLVVRLLPVFCFLGLLLPTLLQVLRYSGGPAKTVAQSRNVRRRLARLNNKAVLRSGGRRASSWPVDTPTASEDKSTIAFRFTQALDVISGDKPWGEYLPEYCTGVGDALVRWIQSLAGVLTTAQPTAATENKKRKRESKRQRNRKNRTHDNSDNEGKRSGDEDGRPVRIVTDGDDCRPRGKYWACPFYIFDPEGHYDCVEKHKMKRVSDVKLHLVRKHARTGFYDCPRCWEKWPRRAEFHDDYYSHIQQGDCQGLRGTQGLEEDEISALENIPRRQPSIGKWYWIWEQFFPNHERPESPFVEDGLNEPRALLFRNAEPFLQVAMQQPTDLRQLFHSLLYAAPAVQRRLRLATPSASTSSTQTMPATHAEPMQAGGNNSNESMTLQIAAPINVTIDMNNESYMADWDEGTFTEYLNLERSDDFGYPEGPSPF
ncbi:Het and ankyrin domain protein [Paramyrothecium foliicola]|nr:Het and ankyrin domain protein [Paramyrothecium foliicola]